MATLIQTLLIVGWSAPLVAGLWLLLLPAGRLKKPGASGHSNVWRDEASRRGPGRYFPANLAIAAVGLTAAAAVIVTVLWAGLNPADRSHIAGVIAARAPVWFTLGMLPVHFRIKLDSLTVILYLTVAIVTLCVLVFSRAYMAADARRQIYFGFLSLFAPAMLGLVLSGDFLVLFVFWEMVGILSYLLIGFWFERPAAASAATKAVIVNRMGDIALLAAIGLCAANFGTLGLDETNRAFQHATAQLAAPGFAGLSIGTWIGLLFLVGIMGKSAQFPLHAWLPDAMEGPTPVSALIHAATMVAAGVYLLARVMPLLNPTVLAATATIGAATMLVGALLACVQTDLKRALAYSTMSQLGLMVFGLGVGAWVGALLQLLLHAFFKSLLFLAAGQVIAATHRQDLRLLGGLGTQLPRTAGAFLIAVLAAAAAGIPWTGFGIGGFYGKDEILTVAFARLTAPPGTAGWIVWYGLLYVVAVAVAYITPFYMGRMFTLIFVGPSRDPAIRTAGHESPPLLRPIIVLALLTIVSGWFVFRGFVAAAAPGATPANWHAAHNAVFWQVGFAWVIGLVAAFWFYRNGLARTDANRTGSVWAAVDRLLAERFYIDHIYHGAARGVVAAGIFLRVCDERLIDGLLHRAVSTFAAFAGFIGRRIDDDAVDGAVRSIGAAFWQTGGIARQLQSGVLRSYLLLLLLMICALLVGFWSAVAACILIAVAAVILFAQPGSASSAEPRP